MEHEERKIQLGRLKKKKKEDNLSRELSHHPLAQLAVRARKFSGVTSAEDAISGKLPP